MPHRREREPGGGYHPDHLGSTSWVTDEAGRVREHVLYFPYGSVWRDAKNDAEGSPPRTQALLFTGKEYDQETGYYYFGARYYDPQVARWLSVDPLPIGRGTDGFHLSLYAYVSWRPIDLTDPTGMFEWSLRNVVHLAAGIATGLAQGVVPLGFLAGAHPTGDWCFDAGRALGLQGASLVDFNFGATMMGGGLPVLAFGGAGTPVSGGLTLVPGLALEVGGLVYVGSAVGDSLLGLNLALSLGPQPGDEGSGGAGPEDQPQSARERSRHSRVTRRKAMRKAGIPTSQQPESQQSTAGGRQLDYTVPKKGGGSQDVSVQHSLTDRGHGPHWEAGPVKSQGQTDSLGRPRLKSGKVKVNE